MDSVESFRERLFGNPEKERKEHMRKMEEVRDKYIEWLKSCGDCPIICGKCTAPKCIGFRATRCVIIEGFTILARMRITHDGNLCTT